MMRKNATLSPQQKDSLVNVIKYQKKSTNPKFHRTFEEEDMSFEFAQAYGDTVQALEDDFMKCISEIPIIRSSAKPNKQELSYAIEMSQKAIDSFEKAKQFCYSKGNGGKIYFQDSWEYCHNSKNPCFSHIDATIKQKQELENMLSNAE